MFIIFFLSMVINTGMMGGAKPLLSDYKNNVYSQWGEDGITQKIFEIIGTTSKVCVEFGAYDGFALSNTANLWTKDTSWKGILIEADKQLFAKLVTNVSAYNCIPIHKMVGISESNSLEAILKEYAVFDPIDLLSIDIDGDDYYIFQSLHTLRPRVIICEYNPSIPAHFDVYTRFGGHVGCSVAALQRVAAEKGYTLVAITDTNCFFVINDEIHKFAAYDIDREHMRIDRYIMYVVSDYPSGYKILVTNDFRDPWGWGGKPSQELFLGNFKIIDAIIKRPLPN